MIKKLSKEWFELRDIRARHFSQSEWIPVYACENICEGECGKTNSEKTYKHIVSALVFNNELEAFKEVIDGFLSRRGIVWDLCCVKEQQDEDGLYCERAILCDYDNKALGRKFVIKSEKDADHYREPMVYQDFLLAYGLVNDGDSWFLLDYNKADGSIGREEIIRKRRNSENKVVCIEVKKASLRDYLAARNAALYIQSYFSRIAVLPEKPEYWGLSEEKIHKEELLANVRYRLEGWRMRDSAIGKILNSDMRAFRVEGELWREEWIERTEASSLMNNKKDIDNFSVWIWKDDAPCQIELSNISECGKCAASCLWFKAAVIADFLKKHNAEIEWFRRDSGRIRLPQEYKGICFAVNEKGFVNVKYWNFKCLPTWQKKIWVDYNEVPQGESEKVCFPHLPEYPDDDKNCASRDYGACPQEASEVRLSKAIKRCIGIFMAHKDDETLFKSLQRFRSLDEEGLQGLVLDMVKYCIERLHKDNLKQAVIKMDNVALDKKENLGSLKLLEKLIKLCGKTEAEAKKIICPLFGLYDLRVKGGGAPLAAGEDSIEGCYSRIGIDRSAPYVEQGAQLLERVAECFEQIANALAVSAQHDKREQEIVQEGAQ